MSESKRATNFSDSEVRLLIELVDKNKDIIECKKTDMEVNKWKNEAWKTIEVEFNSVSGLAFRDIKTLKNKYENLKKRAKKKASDNKTQQMGTGGGPKHEIPLTDIENTVISILGVRAEGLPSGFGIDSVVLRVDESVETEILDVPSTSNDVHDIELHQKNINENGASKKTLDWSSYTPEMLRQPKSSALQGKRKGNEGVSKKIQSWALSKTKYEDVKLECLLEEHSLHLQQMQKEHELKLHLMREEHEKKMAREEEIHRLEVDLLNKKINNI